MKNPPRGLAALPWRLPIWLYKLHLGWLLGERFMLLTHIGRVSGLPRQAVIEVVDRDPQRKIWYAVSGFGEKSHWYRNIMHTPQVTIQTGRRTFRAAARRLPLEEAKAVLRRYASRHPLALRQLGKLIGLPYDGSAESLHRMAAQLPVIAFQETPYKEALP